MITIQDLIDYHRKAAHKVKYDAQYGQHNGSGHLDARVSYDFHLDAVALLEKLKAEVRPAPAPEEPVSEGTRIAAEARAACNGLTAEVARLRSAKAEDLIRGLHNGWKKARKAHLETCKNAQSEIDKLHTENICLQELIQEFYEWSRRDYPTEAEVREIMERYYNLLNHNPNNKPS